MLILRCSDTSPISIYFFSLYSPFAQQLYSYKKMTFRAARFHSFLNLAFINPHLLTTPGGLFCLYRFSPYYSVIMNEN